MPEKLFFDTETTGLPRYNEPSDDPGQPHIVQLAACLVDTDTRKVVASLDLIVKPDGWEIPEAATAIHGITHEHAMRFGVPEALAVDAFMGMWAHRTRVGHNESFDARILRIALKRYVDPRTPGAEQAMSDIWKAGAAECTQRMATPLLTAHLHSKGQKGKTSSLAEAHELVVGHPLQGAHSAMGDTLGCMAVYFGIQDQKRATA